MKPLTPEIEYCRATVKAWEKLRLLYNAVLLIPGGLVLWRTLHLQSQILDEFPRGVPIVYPIAPPLELIALSIVFGFVANICFCLGAYLEFLMTALGFPISAQRSRYFVFGLGVMASVMVIGFAWLYVEYYMISPLVTGP